MQTARTDTPPSPSLKGSEGKMPCSATSNRLTNFTSSWGYALGEGNWLIHCNTTGHRKPCQQISSPACIMAETPIFLTSVSWEKSSDLAVSSAYAFVIVRVQFSIYPGAERQMVILLVIKRQQLAPRDGGSLPALVTSGRLHAWEINPADISRYRSRAQHAYDNPPHFTRALYQLCDIYLHIYI